MSIICGPIVRHSNRDQVNVWLTLDHQPGEIELKAFTDKNQNNEVSQSSSVKQLKIAEHCYSYLLQCELKLDDKHSLIYYDILIDRQGLEATGFNKQICFGNDPLPSLALPETHRHFLQASCRKPHDPENIDQLCAGASHLKSQLNNEQRPSQLVLTGDQIYADDVSPVLLDYIHKARHKLGFSDELVPKANGTEVNPETKIKLDGRDKVATKKYGFSSGESHSHLLTFAEYFCMYLFCFAGQLEDVDFSDYDEIKPRLRTVSKKINGKFTRRVTAYSKSNYKKDLESLQSFANSTAKDVRKLLANIATYMIFDDHDVTDDWNLTEANARGLMTTPLGSQVYINALSAYLLCQHWGNAPHEVADELFTYIEDYAAQPDQSARTPLTKLWKQDWGYVVEQQPPMIVLDTRTDRVYNGDQLGLMSPKRLLALAEKIRDLPESHSAIVVSSTPMYGFTDAEATQLKLTKLKTFADREPWVANEFALQTLQAIIGELPGIKDAIVFSGDVHYAFARRHLTDAGVTFWQLCSSASSNTPVGGHLGLSVLNKLGNMFNKKRTKYLKPQRKKHFLTSHKNIGLLELDEHATPHKSTLLCKSPEGDSYKKIYNLKQYTEIED